MWTSLCPIQVYLQNKTFKTPYRKTKTKPQSHEVMNVLANFIVASTSQCTVYEIMSCTLNLHKVMCQFYLHKAGGGKKEQIDPRK